MKEIIIETTIKDAEDGELLHKITTFDFERAIEQLHDHQSKV